MQELGVPGPATVAPERALEAGKRVFPAPTTGLAGAPPGVRGRYLEGAMTSRFPEILAVADPS